MGKLSRFMFQSLIGLGTAAYGTGVVLMILGAVMVPLAGQFAQMGEYGIVAFFAIILGCGLGGALLTRIGVALRNSGVRMRLEDAVIEGAPLVVYLRPFLTDASAAETAPVHVGKGEIGGLSTHEEHLAEAFAPAGQLVAISARSADEVQPLGAVRINFYAPEWQRHALELIQSARLVVLRCGTTEGIKWELRQVLEHCAPERVVLLLNAEREAARREHAILSAELPHAPPPPGGLWTAHERLAGICIFDRDWKPRLRLFRSLGTRGSVNAPLVPVLTYALEPVFERLGIPWKKPPLPLRIRAVAAFLGVMLALLILGVWIGGALGSAVGCVAGMLACVTAIPLIILGTTTSGPTTLELDSSPIVHPLFGQERGVLRIVNRCTLPPMAHLMIVADGHRIAELSPGESEAAVDIAVGCHLLSACLSTQPGLQSMPIQCDIPVVGSVGVVCSTGIGSTRPRLQLET